MLSEECIQNFIHAYSNRLGVETVNLYQKAVKQLLNHCNKQFDQITPKDIRNWLNHLEINGYQPVTMKTKLAGVKLFYRYCLEEGLMKQNPVISIPFPKVEDSLPYYLQYDQLTKLRQLVEGRLQERAVIEVLYATGVRIRELVAIKKEDIDWEERIIHIPNGKRKKARIVLFTHACAEHLKAYLETRHDTLPFIFVNTTATGPVNVRTTQKKFDTYTSPMGIHFTPHTLRHTFAAHLAMKGMPLECIQVLLGHNSPHQSQLYARLYSQARKEKYDECM